MKMTRLVIVALSLAYATGCQTTLMPTPTVITAAHVDPFKHVVPENQSSTAWILVASARTVSGASNPAKFYTTDRSRTVRVGLATLEIGPGMTWNELIEQSLAGQRTRNPEIVLTEYEEYGPLWSTAWPENLQFDRHWAAPGVDREPGNRFLEAIEERLALSQRNQITVYVHGFNTTFEKNLQLASDFWHYMARDDVVVSFDWASNGSMFSYEEDKSNANFAIWQFRKLMQFLAEHTSAERINIVAHSAGNPVVIEALRQLSLKYYDLDDEAAQRRTRIGRVIFAAPDMDLDSALSAAVDGADRVTQGYIIYASRRDKALGLAGGIFGDVRLGKSIGKLDDDERGALIANDMQWIDVTNAEKRSGTFLGHGYFHANPWVSSDLMIFLRLGAAAEERGLVRDAGTGFLAFPDDYEEKLPEIIRQLQARYDPDVPE